MRKNDASWDDSVIPSIPLYERGKILHLPIAKGGWEGFEGAIF
jgi:hypothetical protein